MENNETGLLFLPYTKINWKWNKRLECKSWNIKFLEEYINGKLLDIGLGIDFWDLISKAKATKAKINKWDYMKPKTFYTANKPLMKWKAAF